MYEKIANPQNSEKIKHLENLALYSIIYPEFLACLFPPILRSTSLVYAKKGIGNENVCVKHSAL